MPGPAVERTINQTPYKEILRSELRNPAFGENFRYEHGDLMLNPVEGGRRNSIRVMDLLSRYGENGVIQITDLGRVEQRARKLQQIFAKSARAVGYPEDKIQLHFAFKANTKGPFVLSALTAGLNAETSGEFDLFNIQRMISEGLIDPKIKVISNGFKLEPPQNGDMGYAQRIIYAHQKGLNVLPVLENGELPFFIKHGKNMDIGLRLKFGQVTNANDLDSLVSRFGLSLSELTKEAHIVKNSDNLKFTMLHAMITAAHTIEPHALAESALFAARIYAELKKENPSLTHLNFGGGFPTVDSGFDHEKFVKIYLSGVKEICSANGVDLPVITIESGSFVAADCEHLVYPIRGTYKNNSQPYQEMKISGTLMNMDDIWVQEDPFTFVAADHGEDTAIPVRLGDHTCDSNCVYPPKDQPNKYIMMPQNASAVVAINVGGYQDVLGGVAGQKEAKLVNHCGKREPKQVYILNNGKVWTNTSPSLVEMSNVAGYDKGMLSLVK